MDIKALISSLGKNYKEILDAGLIPYKTPPTGFAGAEDISLDMAKEGVYLSFKRDGRILQDVTCNVLRPEIKNWIFPSELPFGLNKNMELSDVHKIFGQPIRRVPPKMIMKQYFGRADLYSTDGLHIPVSMQIRYDDKEMVKSISFFPTSELRW